VNSLSSFSMGITPVYIDLINSKAL
jgi:hypothetical protein